MTDYSKYIADYISGNLSQEEMEQFELRKDQDRTLENDYHIVLKSREFLKARSMIEEIENDPNLPHAEAIVQEYFEQEEVEERRKSRIRKVFYISIPIAAALVGLAILISSFLKTDPLSRMYAHYYTPLQSEDIYNNVVRDASNGYLVEGLEYYLDGNYTLAIDQLLEADDNSYFLGLSYMGSKDYLQAQLHFGEYYYDYPYHPGVNWYLGLTYLKLSYIEKAIEHFQRLFLMQNPYQASAARILRKLEKYKAAEGS